MFWHLVLLWPAHCALRCNKQHCNTTWPMQCTTPHIASRGALIWATWVIWVRVDMHQQCALYTLTSKTNKLPPNSTQTTAKCPKHDVIYPQNAIITSHKGHPEATTTPCGTTRCNAQCHAGDPQHYSTPHGMRYAPPCAPHPAQCNALARKIVSQRSASYQWRDSRDFGKTRWGQTTMTVGGGGPYPSLPRAMSPACGLSCHAPRNRNVQPHPQCHLLSQWPQCVASLGGW